MKAAHKCGVFIRIVSVGWFPFIGAPHALNLYPLICWIRNYDKYIQS